MEQAQKTSVVEVARKGWRPCLAKIALIGAIATGIDACVDAYAYPDEVITMSHEDSEPFEGDQLSITTANVHGWIEVAGDETIPREPMITELREVLKQEDSDIVCLQEVNTGGDELKQLHEDGYNLIFSTTIRYPFRGSFGNAVLSKAPLKLVEVQNLENPSTVSPRNAITFEINIKDDRSLQLAATHLSVDEGEGQIQAKKLMDKFGNSLDGVCGDLNSSPDRVQSGAFAPLISRSGRYLSVPTFPSHNPRRAIDHVEISCGRKLYWLKSTDDFGSDHLAMTETFDISGC